jgi:hypothetical protein
MPVYSPPLPALSISFVHNALPQAVRRNSARAFFLAGWETKGERRLLHM